MDSSFAGGKLCAERLIATVLVGAVTLGISASALHGAPVMDSARTQTFAAVADAYVTPKMPRRNHGRVNRLLVGGASPARTYIRFDLRAMTGNVTRVTLRLYAVGASTTRFDVRPVGGAPWTERTITYRSAPRLNGRIASSARATKSGKWTTVDVTRLIRAGRIPSLALISTGTDAAAFASRESGNSPRLLLETAPKHQNPVCADITLTTAEDEAGQTSPVCNYDPPSFEIASQGTRGSASVVDGQLRYQPNANANGADSFSYRARDGSAESAPATVTVTITPVNDPPVCADVNDSTPQGTAQTVAVDCSDLDGDPLAYAVVSAPMHGSVTGSGPDFVYTPTAAYVGPDSFTFHANDGAASSNIASVTVRVDPVIAAAGDIADCNLLGDEITGALLDDIDGTVVVLGDNAYYKGTFAEFINCYEPSWGRHKARTYPAAGNHEYADPTGAAQGYFDYMNGVGNFGGPAGDRDKGYYSFDLGVWHFVVVNSNCIEIGGCDVGSAQEAWLRTDLAAHPAACTAAAWHHSRFSSGSEHGSTPRMESIWQALYHGGADIVMSAHEHNYERFVPQTATGVVDPVFGLREFVVGTGGEGGGYPFGPPHPNSEVRDSETLGVLKVVLRPAGFEWSFVHEPGAVFTDVGSGACHGQPDPANTVPPTVSGNPRQGRTLTVTPGTWVGSPPLTYAYRWRSCVDVGADSCTDIPGATGSTYSPGPAEIGFRLRAVVTGTSAAGSTSARSNKTNLIQPP